MKGQYQGNVDNLINTLKKRGVKIGTERDPQTKKTYMVADASEVLAVGIDTLGKLDFLATKLNCEIYLPQYRPRMRELRIH